MAKKEQIKVFEETRNNIPLCIDPCKRCKIYKEKGHYDAGHFNQDDGEWEEGICKECCWFYDSKFEIAKEK